MIIVGIILALIGAVSGYRLLVQAGLVLVIVGLVIDLLAGVGHVGALLF